MVSSSFRPWARAWAQAASGADGFWGTAVVEEHFRTASITTGLLASGISALLCDYRHIATVIEVGAGNGALLAALAERRPDLTLTGIDMRGRPDGLPRQIGWRRDLWDVGAHRWAAAEATELLGSLDRPALVVSMEWLDDLPCALAVRSGGQLLEVEVDGAGVERLGGQLDPVDAAWCRRWWPDGDRVEVGSTRDRAWVDVLTWLGRHGGLGLAVDYGHVVGNRPARGSLAAYHRGQQVLPRPRPEVNVTAAVAIDALAAAAEQRGAVTLARVRQSEALSGLLPPTEPARTLAGLAERSEAAALVSPRGWGDHWWLLQRVPASGVVD